METTKLTIRLQRDLLEQAKRYAQDHETNLTRLINEYLRHVTAQEEFMIDAPIVDRLTGTLSKEVSVDDYQQHLEEKYGRQN